jgi:hypothetical protein
VAIKQVFSHYLSQKTGTLAKDESGHGTQLHKPTKQAVDKTAFIRLPFSKVLLYDAGM